MERTTRRRWKSARNETHGWARMMPLEMRLLMCADGNLLGAHSHAEAGPIIDPVSLFVPAAEQAVAATSTSTSDSTAVMASSLSGVPLLHSNPNAYAKIYLDFDGASAQMWGSYSVSSTPAYDQDGNTGSFSSSELSSIQQIWSRISEKYSPFNIDVTTQDPGNLTDKRTQRIVIGGSGGWLGMTAGGISYVSSFYSGLPNISWVFSKNLSSNPKYVAEAASHEAGHAFGLQHQSTYDSSGHKTAEYNSGTSAKAPTMGNSYGATRGLWWYGTSSASGTMQNDLSILSGSNDGFGYRGDEGSSLGSPIALTMSGTTAKGSGIITTTGDWDYFSFSTGGGGASFTVSPAQYGGMLDLQLKLENSSGSVLATANTSGLGETIAKTLAAGSYRLLVGSHGSYGDIGQYFITGSIGSTSTVTTVGTVPAAPTMYTPGVLSSSQIHVTWTNVSGESGFKLERSTDGVNYSQIGTTGADVTSYTDSGLTAGKLYYYRTRAYNSAGNSSYSNTAHATTSGTSTSTTAAPAAPVMYTPNVLSSSQLRVSWTNVSNESGYKIERSTDGVHFSQIGTTGAGGTAYTDSGLSAGKLYYYRVRAYNSAGNSSYSNMAHATTSGSSTSTTASIPAAPVMYTPNVLSSSQLRISWTNVSGESGYKLERSADGVNYSQIATTGADVTSYTNGGLTAGKLYYYRVRAYNSAGTSAYSNIAHARPASAAPLPAASTGALAGAIDLGASRPAWRTAVGAFSSTPILAAEVDDGWLVSRRHGRHGVHAAAALITEQGGGQERV